MKPSPDPKFDPDFPKLWVRAMDKKGSKFGAGPTTPIQYDYFPWESNVN